MLSNFTPKSTRWGKDACNDLHIALLDRKNFKGVLVASESQ